MQKTKPYISVITVVKNAVGSIEKCILSIIDNKLLLPDNHLEYIIIDGNSLDGTQQIIQQYSTHIDHFESKEDSGVSEAFNKGMKLASGQWILYVNADDWLVNGSLLTALPSLQNEQESTTFLTGSVFLWENNKQITVANSRINNISRESSIHHASTFIYKDHLLNEQWFSTNLTYAMDYEFFLRLITIKDYKIKKIPFVICNRTLSGLSYVNHRLAMKETMMIRSAYFNYWNTKFWYTYASAKDKVGRLLKSNRYLMRIYKCVWGIWNA